MKSEWFWAAMLLVMTTGVWGACPDRITVETDLAVFRDRSRLWTAEERSLVDPIEIDAEKGRVTLLVYPGGETVLSESGLHWNIIKTQDGMKEDKIDPQYLDYDDVTSLLETYESSYPSIVKRYDLGTTFENRHIWAVKISDYVTHNEDEPVVLFTALHQAREIMSTEIAMDIVDYLASGYGSDPDVTNWVNAWEIWVIPMMNPDGSAYCWSDDPYWTKNRRDLGNEIYGVDIGHNYPTDWGACYGSASDPNSNAYRGPEAASEPEVQALINLVQAHHPLVMVSYHSFDEMVILPYGCYGEKVPEDTIVRSIGNKVAQVIQRDDASYGYDLGTWWQKLYPYDGNEIDYMYATYGTFAFVVEVNASSYYPDYSIRNTTVFRNRAGWQKILNLLSDGSVLCGHVWDACTSNALSARLYFADYPLTPKESPRMSNSNTGRFYILGKQGTLILAAEADGYLRKEVPVIFTGDPLEMDIELVPTDQPALSVWSSWVDDSETGDNDGQLDPGEQADLDICLLAPGMPVTGIQGVLSTDDEYITIIDGNAQWPDLPYGSAAWCTEDTFTIQASSSTPESHVATFNITFFTNEALCDDTDTAYVSVQTFVYQCPFWEENLDSDPGWLITSYPTQNKTVKQRDHDWEFGVPVVGPPGAYTGDYVYGTDLDGPYANSLTLCLTTPPIDCSDLTETTLQFARFLQVERNYDHGRVRIRNQEGADWTTVFDSETEPGWENDTEWAWAEIDISDYADNEPFVQIRFDVSADTSVVYNGFYIDDVHICGNFYGVLPPQPTPTPRLTVTPTPVFTPTPHPHTPTATSTPALTATPAPPTATATALPETPTQTPIPPTYTPLPPTSTPSTTTFRITLHLNQRVFTAGDRFHLECEIERHGMPVTVDEYIILDVYGMYFFWPSWTQDVDYETFTYPDGYHNTMEIFDFIWPEVEGHAEGLMFYAGCLETGTTRLLGDISSVSFDY